MIPTILALVMLCALLLVVAAHDRTAELRKLQQHPHPGSSAVGMRNVLGPPPDGF
ncbi:MAG: hypothetical protein M0T79_06820 [Actinomycetota bacterium]|nr:hypothetical protein [Actinomycetota bacterium]